MAVLVELVVANDTLDTPIESDSMSGSDATLDGRKTSKQASNEYATSIHKDSLATRIGTPPMSPSPRQT